MLGVDQLHYYDIYPPLVSLDREFNLEDSKKITLEATEILGDDWVSMQKEAMDDRWMHVYPQRGKRSGAYMSGFAYDVHPYLLLNHNNDYMSGAMQCTRFMRNKASHSRPLDTRPSLPRSRLRRLS
jgi:oligoendopeptidase F